MGAPESANDAGAPPLGTPVRFASTSTDKPEINPTIAKFYLQSLARDLLPGEKVARCLRAIVPGKHGVGIKRHAGKNTAHYTNLRTCDSVWACPICSAKITERRAVELEAITTAWQSDTGFVAMLTFTVSHTRADRAEDVLIALRRALRRFKSGRGFQDIKARFNWFGSVTGLETTHGANGWHIHFHMLGFFHPLADVTWREFEPAVKAHWLSSLMREGLGADWEHGVTVTLEHERIAEYIAKFGKLPKDTRWTAAREIAKSPTKKAHEGGRTPFELLRDYGDGDKVAGRLFVEYFYSFKGKHQMDYSDDIKQWARENVGLEVQTDEQIIASEPEGEINFAWLNGADWYKLLKLPTDVRGELLVMAGKGDFEGFQAFLSNLGVLVSKPAPDAENAPAGEIEPMAGNSIVLVWGESQPELTGQRPAASAAPMERRATAIDRPTMPKEDPASRDPREQALQNDTVPTQPERARPLPEQKPLPLVGNLINANDLKKYGY
jgi:hypothetical protein